MVVVLAALLQLRRPGWNLQIQQEWVTGSGFWGAVGVLTRLALSPCGAAPSLFLLSALFLQQLRLSLLSSFLQFSFAGSPH